MYNGVRVLMEGLHAILHGHGWQLRHKTSSWVQWIPRERIRLADKLANHALDTGHHFLYVGPLAEVSARNSNYVIMCDGAYRSSCRKAAAGWTILCFREHDVALVAAGANILADCCDSMQAEMSALHMGIESFASFSFSFMRNNHLREELPCSIHNRFYEAEVVV